MDNAWMYIVAALAAIGGAVAWRQGRIASRNAARRRAMPAFDQRRGELAKLFLDVAAASGKPRGLRWKAIELTGQPLFATDVASNALYALIGATISFEAIEGGAMEDVEAVGNLRSATAVFVFRGGKWTTDGRVIFNLEPGESLERFEGSLKPVAVVKN